LLVATAATVVSNRSNISSDGTVRMFGRVLCLMLCSRFPVRQLQWGRAIAARTGILQRRRSRDVYFCDEISATAD